MSAETVQLTDDNFYKSGYEDIIDSCDKKECYKYATILLKKARELESSSDFINSEVCTLIGRVTSLNLSNRGHPIFPLSREK